MIYLSAASRDRLSHLRDFISVNEYGLEIGPFHSPVCPKSGGFNVISIDAFSREQLINAHKHDQFVMARQQQIEEVNIVSTAPLFEAVHSYWQSSRRCESEAVERSQLDYIVSSHNFEHLANPVQFLIDASKLLRDEGMLSMAIPIGSRCFDILRPLTSTGVLIDAFRSAATQPSLGKVFDSLVDAASLVDGGDINSANATINAIKLRFPGTNFSQSQYLSFLSQIKNGYVDAHCSVFNPYSFQLIVRDLIACGIVQNLSIIELIENGTEFIVHLKKRDNKRAEHEFSLEERKDLMKKTVIFHLKDIQHASSQ